MKALTENEKVLLDYLHEKAGEIAEFCREKGITDIINAGVQFDTSGKYPGHASVGFVIVDKDGVPVYEVGRSSFGDEWSAPATHVFNEDFRDSWRKQA